MTNYNKGAKRFTFVLSAITMLVISFLFSCLPDEDKQEENLFNENEDAEGGNIVDTTTKEALTKARYVLYSLPSPLEIAKLIKESGCTYNPEILNPTGNVDTYVTNKSMALNLGIYGADLSYVSLFDQTQASIDYMTASRKLADGLGILDAINDSTIQALRQNINNRDAIVNIISQTFMNSDSYLKENQRDEVAAMIVVGGWIEGLYLAIQLTENSLSNNEVLIKRIIDQKLSLLLTINLLELYKNNENISAILNDMKAIKAVYDEIDEEDLNKENFEKLANKVELIRNSYTI